MPAEKKYYIVTKQKGILVSREEIIECIAEQTNMIGKIITKSRTQLRGIPSILATATLANSEMRLKCTMYSMMLKLPELVTIDFKAGEQSNLALLAETKRMDIEIQKWTDLLDELEDILFNIEEQRTRGVEKMALSMLNIMSGSSSENALFEEVKEHNEKIISKIKDFSEKLSSLIQLLKTPSK